MNGGVPPDVEEMIRSMFGESFGHQQQRQQVHIINISLADAYVGKSIKISATATLNIPKGARHGSKFFSEGKLYRLDIQPHFKFKRANDDLLVDIEINAIEAILGTDAILEHLDSATLQFTIPPGIQHGQIVKLSGKGMKNPETDRTGDMLVRVSVTIPRTLTDVEKAALKTVSHRSSINI